VTNLGRALEETREAGIRIYGAGLSPDSANALTAKVLTPAVLILGNETKGIRPGVARHCAELLHIPMRHGVDSLNVAQAGAMLLACFARAVLLDKGQALAENAYFCFDRKNYT